jgi:L-fuculose-phosphate aldolase
VTERRSLRRLLLDAAKAMSASGLSPQRSGNLSLRDGDGFLVTPSGLPYDEMDEDDLVTIEPDGRVSAGQRKPTSELPFHLAIYAARPDAQAIVHAHSVRATAVACLRRDLPPFHYMVAAAGGRDIRCATYATFGTEELARSAVRALEGRRACLLANHGQVAIGRTVGAALELAHEVETLADAYLACLAVGEPALLDDEEMARVVAKFAGYGQP